MAKTAVVEAVCSVCEGHEDDHTSCANVAQKCLQIAEMAREELRAALGGLKMSNGCFGLCRGWTRSDPENPLRHSPECNRARRAYESNGLERG